MKTMRTLLILCFLSIATSLSAQQLSKNALGLRIGDNDGLGAEITYQRMLNESNRLEFDLGFRNSNDVEAFKLVGLYQWVRPLDGNFNWYLGAGAGVGSYSTPGDDGSFALVAGNAGIEYNFNIPLLLSLDVRPELSLDDTYSDDVDFDIALGIKYQF
ncbi:outer membrane protein [Kordia sp.]|uniref:outer membrane protein n=1 Tax=Kordia sp. TaxID=1965332 RepID=UPI003D2DF9A4